MKKLIVIALAVVMALSIVAFAACDSEQTVNGEYSYANPFGDGTYGVEVKVTVKGGVITAVELVDHEGWVRTSADYGTWTSHDATEAAYPAFLKCFEGLTVKEVKEIKVTCAENGVPNDLEHEGIKGAPDALELISGATQSCGRIILAVQNALSKLK